jgi:Trk K+ transport system NAD-binding subunit
MKDVTALVFGFNNYASEIIDNVIEKYTNVYTYSLDAKDIENEKYKIKNFDLSDEWNEVSDIINIHDCIAFCVLEDDAQNIFLTISLRASFKDLMIVALATNNESANKLEMAGANKVIPIVKTTADIISNIITKPIATKVLHSILYEESDLKIAQILVEKADDFHGEFPADIDWSRYRGIIVLYIMHEDMSREFIYSSKTKHNSLVNGDILIVTGYERDIQEFEKLIGSRKYVNWGNRSR